MSDRASRVLVIGGTGMLGHKVWQVFRSRFDTWVTGRDLSRYTRTGLFDDAWVTDGVRADDFDSVVRAFNSATPDVVVNCVGVVKQRKEAADPVPSITVNSLFPHRLAALAADRGARVIHISTDCVFAGTRGMYREDDMPDARDLYGLSKLLGEVAGERALTIRTSMIGRELSATTGLLEWFLAQPGRVRGYSHARFSGLTTLELARVLAEVVEKHPALHGLYHVASEPISKYDLLCTLNEVLGRGVEIEPDAEVRIDRTLDGSRFASATGLAPANWDRMLAEMAADPTPYEEWRRHIV